MAKKSPLPSPDEIALLKAAAAGDLQTVQSLVAKGLNVNVASKEFKPPLVGLLSAATSTNRLVAHKGKLVPEAQQLWEQKDALFATVTALLAAGADPNGSGEQPLALLGRRVPDDIRLPIARMLLERGANPDAVDKLGDSPLLIAALYNATGFARLLLDHPVDVNRLAPGGSILDIVESNLEKARENAPNEAGELEALRDLLTARGAKHKSELAIAAEKPAASDRHIASDFLDLINSGEAEWALLAVKAPFDAVSDAYLAFSKSKDRRRGVPLRPAAEAEEVPPFAAVVDVRNSPWTLLLCTIFYVRAADFTHVASAAKELSATIKTRVLTWGGTEETDNGVCELFENGQPLSKAGNKKSIALLTTQGITLPAFYPARSGSDMWLSIEKTSIDKVERADLIAR